MLCPKCMLEMWVKKVENNIMTHECKKCGEIIEVDISEIEDETENEDE